MYDVDIKSMKKSSLFSIFIISLLFLFYTGCSDSHVKDENSYKQNISGIVQKGNFIDGTLTAQRVEVNGSVFGEIVSVPIDDKAQYTLNLSWKGLTLLTAKGKFFNEYTGQNSTDEVELYALINVEDKEFSGKINLNLFTSLESQRVVELMKKGSSYNEAFLQSRVELERIFSVPTEIKTTSLDIYDFNSTLKTENLNLLLFSGTLLKIIEDENISKALNKATLSISKKRYRTQGRMRRFYDDYADNGKFDGDAQDDLEKLKEVDKGGILGIVDANLHINHDSNRGLLRGHDWYNLGVGNAPVGSGDGSVGSVGTGNGPVSAGNGPVTGRDFPLGDTGTTFEITDFSLYSVALNDVNQNYNNEPVVYMGSSSDNVKFKFRITRNSTAQAYTYTIYANAGTHSRIVKENISVGATFSAKVVEVEVDSDLKEFFKEAYSRGDDVTFKAVSNVAINNIAYVSKVSNPMPKFAELSKTLTVNGKDLNITSATYLYENGDSSCHNFSTGIIDSTDTVYAKFNISVAWQPSENWDIANGGFTHGCVEVNYNSTTNSFDLNTKTEIKFSGNHTTSFTAEGYTLELYLNNTVITTEGLVVSENFNDNTNIFKLSFPENITSHIGAENNSTAPASYVVVPYEIPQFNLFYVQNVNISDNWDALSLKSVIAAKEGLDAWLHAKGLPFYIKMDNTILFDSNGIHLANVSAKYIHTGAIGNIADMISNDISFSNPIGEFNATINADGLQTDSPIHFDAVTDVKTHFPYTKMTQSTFDINIVNGEIVPVDITGEGSYKLGYSSECKEISCSDEENPITSYTLTNSTRYISKDGAFMSSVDMTGKKIAWGAKYVDGIAWKHIFERNADTKGVMYVPGFSINANEPEALISTLLGSRDLDSTGKLSNTHILESSFTKKGNGLFAGVNVGSLYLDSDNDPLTSLAGTTMTVQVGGVNKTSLTLNSNNKSKYFIRPSGITGVFNGSLAQANAELSIYGYPMTFKSFAFSQVQNKLNDKTLIDGDIAVANPGGFKVDFSSLALDCTGALNGGTVEETDCSSSHKVNCGQKLTAWKTDTQFVSVDFQENPKGVCFDKTLRIGHVLDVKALTNPLGLTTNWRQDGYPENAIVSGSSSNFLDRNEHNNTSKGFAVALDSGAKLTNGGWYKFSGAFGLPFWGMQPVDLGLANKENEHRETTRVMPRNMLTLDSYTENKAQKFMASYQWGSTGFGFELPVVYNAKKFDEESIFIGKKLEIDLGVMNANAGINYIKPNDTKISFGASADFEAMGKLQIKIDLNDPKSIKKIDDTLDTFGIGGNPIYNTIGLVLDPLHEAEAYADKGLLLGMEELGVLALEQGADEAGIDPFEKLADTFVQIHALPKQAIDMTEDYISDELDSVLGSAIGGLDIALENTANTVNPAIEDAIRNANTLLVEVSNNLNKFDRLEAQLDDIDNILTTVDIATNWNKINKKLDSLISPNTLNSTQCTEYLLTKSELFKPVSTLTKNILDVNDKLQKVKISTVKRFGSLVEKKIDFDTSGLVHTFEKTQSIANSLKGEIVNANGTVKTQLGAFCGQVATIRSTIESTIDKTAKWQEIHDELQDYVRKIKTQIAVTKQNVKAEIEWAQGILKSSNFTLNGMTEADKNRLRTLGSRYIVTTLENITFSGNKTINTLKKDLDKALKEIPQPTADELRRIVVTKILDTQPVANIRVAMNDALSPVMDEVREVVVDLFSSVNQVIYDVFDKLSAKANKLLANATSAVKAMPIKSGKMDGYALISGDELDRLHVGAEWKVDTGNEDTSYSFNGALDMERWGAGGKAGCGGGTSTDGNMDVKISTRDIKLALGGKEMSVDELYFGFTLQSALPVGIMGGIESQAGFDFNKFALYDMKLLVGIGAIETYLGAKSSAIFDVYQMNAAFLVGKTCGKEIITKLDPEVADFITLPNNVFKGAYIRGGASFPIWDNGCALTVGVTADLGAWVLIPGTYGGLVGGGAYGKALCIASIKGQVKALFQKSGDNIKFQGSGWGAAGAGWCSPSKWYSVAKSRKDSWCGTGDAQFGAEYNDGWKLLDIDTDAVF